MKPTLPEAYPKTVSARPLIPAEACSELGATASRPRQYGPPFARWLRLAQRWLAHHYRLHG